MKNYLRFGLQLILFGGAFGFCIAIAAALASMKKEAADAPDKEVDLGPHVWAAPVKPTSFSEPIIAYGTVRVPKTYAIRSQISGEVTFVSPSFVAGRMVKRGEKLIDIDPKDVELAIAEAEANLYQLQANIDKLEVEFAPIDASIEALNQDLRDQQRQVESKQKQVDLQAAEVERIRVLVDKGAQSRSALDAATQQLNTLQQGLMLPQARISQIPIEKKAKEGQKRALEGQRKVLEAQQKIMEVQLQRQRNQLGKTTMTAPARGVIVLREPSTGVAAKQLSTGDVVAPGIDLGWIMPVDEGMEIPCSIDIESARWIRLSGENVNLEDLFKGDEVDPDAFREFLPRDVKVRWYSDERFEWTGRADRFLGELDVATRSATLIIHIDDPKIGKLSETEMPLTPGMYCTIEIPSRIEENSIVIRRSALREGNRVFVAKDDTLLIQKVESARMTKDSIVIRSGLKKGDLLILSDIPQAAPGMKVQPEIRRDEKD